MNLKNLDAKKKEELLIDIIKKESNIKNSIIRDANFKNYSYVEFESLTVDKLNNIYESPTFIGWWSYSDNTPNIFSFLEIYKNKNNISGLILDDYGIAISEGKININKNHIKEIKLIKKYLSIFPHKNSYLIIGKNSILIDEYKKRIFGKIYLNDGKKFSGDNAKAEFCMEIPPKSYTLNKILYKTYLENINKIN
ncbi:MAG: hypothetical protein QXK76_03350 [Candidatus Woesearchaeota archaeon]